MNRISSLLLIVFSLVSTACITPVRPVVVLGQPGVIYRGSNQNSRISTVTVSVINHVAGVNLDIMVGNTLMERDLKTGGTQDITFSCDRGGLVSFSVGRNGNNRRRGTAAQFVLSAKAHTDDGEYMGLGRGAPQVNLRCDNNRPQHIARRWEVRQIDPPAAISR